MFAKNVEVKAITASVSDIPKKMNAGGYALILKGREEGKKGYIFEENFNFRSKADMDKGMQPVFKSKFEAMIVDKDKNPYKVSVIDGNLDKTLNFAYRMKRELE